MAVLWSALPDEVLAAIARLLLGVDLLQLSHVDRRALCLLSDLFASRLSHVRYAREETSSQRIANSKRAYAQASSLRFGGQPEETESRRLPQSFAPVFWSTDTLFGLFAREDGAGAPCFTLDAWFSLSQPLQGVFLGGVLLGLQSEKCREDSGRWPDFHCQVLHVDAQRNLFCSVTAEKPHVAVQLQLGRWYHVALVFDDQVQSVYLDGELVDTQYGQQHQLESYPYYYAQVGAGCISGDAVGKPTDLYRGWYTFHGVVDNLRVWHEAMSAEQIAALSRDYAVLLRRPTFSLKRDVPAWMAHGVETVRCSRPRERWCEVVAASKRTEDHESWV
ncbi:uncharacterized protein KRP23_9924 [Phytophthora ramorum]|uniref:uncharacterized protein n=1 Tax=Phytophthora ramorum TaxID=164328 RepID=UPI0030B091B6|nr:hypothetical protein KRP23_9924 [Phytophthora ramorum]